MAETHIKFVNDTVTLGVMMTRRGTPVTGETPTVEMRRMSDGRYWDWNTLVWSTSPTGTKEATLVEKTWLGGFYTKTWDHGTTDPDAQGEYTAIYRNVGAPNDFTSIEIFYFRFDWSEGAGVIADQVWEEALADHLGTAGSAAEQLAIVRGMCQQNYILDNTVHNSLGLLLEGRIRIFDTAANVPATGGGSETTGLIATYNIETTPESGDQDLVDTYRVVKA